MILKKSLKGSALIVSILGIAVSSVIFLSPTLGLTRKDSQTLPASIIPAEKISPSLPTHLKIPEINVDASIRSVGLTPDGAMGSPKGPNDVVWFNLGPHPGDTGSAVLAGHYGRWKNGKGSIFDNLNKLKKGDLLYVENEKGTLITFVVREIRSYNPEADASDIFNSNDEKSHLNLITCEGTWNKTLKSYPARLVVFTDKN